jgi:hypothetical protein
MRPRPPRLSTVPAPTGSEPALERCPHPGSRIDIEVTSDLGFEYCPECDQKSWWRRSSAGITRPPNRVLFRRR